MTHPEDLFAGYVDGTLPEDERAVVDAHLAGCATCRDEIQIAAHAVAALSALPEEPVPFGVTGPVLAEARRSATPRRSLWERYQWAAGLAAATSLVLIAGVLLPQLTGGSSDDGTGALRAPTAESGGASDATLGASEEAVQVEILGRDLDDRDVKSLAKEAAQVAPAAPERDVTASFAEPGDAISCLVASGATIDDRDVLVRVIQATYLGTPAYLGVLHEGPGGGLPPQRIVVWVVSSADCAILTLASQNV